MSFRLLTDVMSHENSRVQMYLYLHVVIIITNN